MNESATQLGSLPRDQNSTAVQVPTGFQTSDATATPKNSPFTLTGGIDVITRPTNAVEVVFYPVSHDLLVSEVAAQTTYTTVQAGTSEVFEISRMDFIYVKGTTSDTLNFRFNLI